MKPGLCLTSYTKINPKWTKRYPSYHFSWLFNWKHFDDLVYFTYSFVKKPLPTLGTSSKYIYIIQITGTYKSVTSLFFFIYLFFHITFLRKVHLVKAMVFPVVKYGCESWTIKKATCQRIDTFKLRCRKRLLSVPWTARSSNKSIQKEINPEYSLEGYAEAPILCPVDVKN